MVVAALSAEYNSHLSGGRIVRRYVATLPAPSDGCSSGGRGKALGVVVAAAEGPKAAAGEDDDGLVGRRAGRYAAMLPAPSDGCSSGGRGKAQGALAAVVAGPAAAVCDEDDGLAMASQAAG